MARVTISTVLRIPPVQLWELVRWEGRFRDWYPDARSCAVDGTVKGSRRRIRLGSGAELLERLEHRSVIENAYTYSVIDSPYPVAGCLAQIRLLAGPQGRTTLVWSANFEPRGVGEEEAEDFIRNVYQAGFDRLGVIAARGAGDAPIEIFQGVRP